MPRHSNFPNIPLSVESNLRWWDGLRTQNFSTAAKNIGLSFNDLSKHWLRSLKWPKFRPLQRQFPPSESIEDLEAVSRFHWAWAVLAIPAFSYLLDERELDPNNGLYPDSRLGIACSGLAFYYPSLAHRLAHPCGSRDIIGNGDRN